MCKANFRQRRRDLIMQHRAITDQIEQLGLPRSADERELLFRLDKNEQRVSDSIYDLEEAHRAKSIRSRHAIVTVLKIMKGRDGLPLPMSSYIDDLIVAIEEWRRSEPVIMGGNAGRVNA